MMAGGTGGIAFPDPGSVDASGMDSGDRGCGPVNGCAGNVAINLAKAGEAYREFWEAPTGANYPDRSDQIPSITSCQYSPKFPDNATFRGVPIQGGLVAMPWITPQSSMILGTTMANVFADSSKRPPQATTHSG